MFRTIKKSVQTEDHFGAGSVVQAGGNNVNELWLVVALSDYQVALLSLEAFTCTKPIEVFDINYLQEDEARRLVDGLRLNYAFSDFTLHAKGFKQGSNLNLYAFKY